MQITHEFDEPQISHKPSESVRIKTFVNTLTFNSKKIDDCFSVIDEYLIDLKSLIEDVEYSYIDSFIQKESDNSDKVYNYFYGSTENFGKIIDPDKVFKDFNFLNNYQKKLLNTSKTHLMKFNRYFNSRFPNKEIEDCVHNCENPNPDHLKLIDDKLMFFCEELSSLGKYLSNINSNTFSFSSYIDKSKLELTLENFLGPDENLLESVKQCIRYIATFGDQIFESNTYYYKILEATKPHEEGPCVIQ